MHMLDIRILKLLVKRALNSFNSHCCDVLVESTQCTLKKIKLMEILSLLSLDCILFEPLNSAFGQMSSKSGLYDDRFHFLSPLHHPAENLSGSNSLHQTTLKPINLVSSIYLQSLLFFHLPDKVIGLALLGLK